MTYDSLALKGHDDRSVLPGLGVAALGVVALLIAGTQYVLFADVSVPKPDERTLLGMSPGTAAYVLGYGGAGIALIGLGIAKIHRARRGR